MRPLLVLLLVASALSGCLYFGPGCDSPQAAEILTPLVEGRYLHTDASQDWDTLLLANTSQAVGNTSTTPFIDPPSWTAEQVEISPAAAASNFTLLRVHPGTGNATLRVISRAETSVHGVCEGAQNNGIAWTLMPSVPGAMAKPGQGVHVLTAGFWENGTLFYTNIEALDHDKAWPRASWYEWEGGDPLPVYVYDQDRAEEPMLWHGTTAGTPLGAPTQNATAWDYFTTIPGFNNALKGLSTNTVRVVRLTPEEGYTRAGNEQHPLYGAALVFYIKVLDVEDLPCPADLGPTLCGLPNAVTQGLGETARPPA